MAQIATLPPPPKLPRHFSSPLSLSLILINGCLCYVPAWMGRATLLSRPKRGLRSCNLKQFWGSVSILLFSIVSDPTVKIFPF